MAGAYIGWAIFLLVLLVLGWIAFHFSRHTFRVAVAVTLLLTVVGITAFGLTLESHPGIPGAFPRGGDALAHVMLLPPHGRNLAWWVFFAVLIAGVLAWFDTASAKREPPRVSVAASPGGQAGDAGSAGRGEIGEELKFRLAAAEVSRPASMPGGSALGKLATVISSADAESAKAAAMLVRGLDALTAKPPAFEVRYFVEDETGEGGPDPAGRRLRITAEVQNAGTGEIIATSVLGPCGQQEAAWTVAGFTARQVYARDPSTPAWALGSLDGKDLSAYLRAQGMRPDGPGVAELRQYRQSQRAELGKIGMGNANASLARYELASLHELLGDPVAALELHLRNRVYHPWFLKSRYRLAVLLSQLASREVSRRDTDTILGNFNWAASMLRRPNRWQPGRPQREQPSPGHPVTGPDPGSLQRLLLGQAMDELRFYRNRMRVPRLLLRAFASRKARRALLAQVRGKPCWWRHPRRRLSAPWVAFMIAEQRQQSHSGGSAAIPGARVRALRPGTRKCLRTVCPMTRFPVTGDLTEACQEVLGKLGLKRLDPYDRDHAGARSWLAGSGRRKPGGWPVWEAVPWQAIYNAACLHALAPTNDGRPGTAIPPAAWDTAVRLLRLAVDHPGCELTNPHEWMSADPGLTTLRQHPGFRALMSDLTAGSVASQRLHPDEAAGHRGY